MSEFNEVQSGQEARKQYPFITVYVDTATPEDIKRLEDLGWDKGGGQAGFDGVLDLMWYGDGEPTIPDDLRKKLFNFFL